MAITQLQPCRAHDAFVTVNAYDSGVMSGYLIHPRLGPPIPIKSLSHLIRLLDQAQQLESVPCKPMGNGAVNLDSPNRIASFTVSVLFRQNYTIQGKLIWNEKSMEATFRSALELIYLMDDILATGAGEPGEENAQMNEA